MLTGWVALHELGNFREAISAKGSIQSIRHCGLRGIRARTGDEDALHLTVALKSGHHDFALMLMLCPVNHRSPVQSSRASGEGTGAG